MQSSKKIFLDLNIVSFLIIITSCIIIALGNINMLGISQKLNQKEIFEKYSMVSIAVVLSLIIGFLIGRRAERTMLTFGIIAFIISFILLVLVEFTGVHKYGSRRWIYIGGMSIHPTELIKVPIIMITSYYLAYKDLSRKILVSIPVIIVPSILVLKHPDYGSAGSILFVLLVSVFVSEIPMRFIILIFIIIGLSSPLVWEYGLKDYHRERIIGLLEQEERAMEIAYQTVQSKIAIASGGLYGAGIGKGEHGSGQWIPNLHTDFALASISEDIGFVGSTITIILFMILITLLTLKSIASEVKIAKTTCILTVSLIFFHAFVNIGMVSGILPVVGIPLTFISYAGTHNVVAGFLVGLCSGIPERKPTPIKPL